MTKELYLERAENELELAKAIYTLSNKKNIQADVFRIKTPLTFFSSVISHSYYSIFYMAKAYLFLKGVKTSAPFEHKKTFEAFKRFVDDGVVDVELLRIYERMLVRADSLLGLYSLEKGKRGRLLIESCLRLIENLLLRVWRMLGSSTSIFTTFAVNFPEFCP